MATPAVTVYYVGGIPACDDAPWTAIWLGHLGGFWELILADDRGGIRYQEMTSADTGGHHPLDGRLEALGVEFIPDGEWAQRGMFRFERPIRPWKRQAAAPEPDEAPGADAAQSLGSQ